MKIGTLGAGEVAQALAIHLLKAGHEVLLSNSRGPSSLEQLVSKLDKGARAVTMHEAAKAPIVILAVPWPKVEAVLGKLPDWEGRILIDATNHFLLPSMELADLKGRVSSEIVSELAPSAKVVKALNTSPFNVSPFFISWRSATGYTLIPGGTDAPSTQAEAA